MARKKETSYITENKIFAKRLREAMELRGENQTTLAKKAGLQRQTISLYVNGQSSPDTDRLTKLSKALEVSADYLLGLTKYPTTNKDLQGVCEYTKLRADLVENLGTLSGEHSKNLNDFLPEYFFSTISSDLERVKIHNEADAVYSRCFNLASEIIDGNTLTANTNTPQYHISRLQQVSRLAETIAHRYIELANLPESLIGAITSDNSVPTNPEITISSILEYNLVHYCNALISRFLEQAKSDATDHFSRIIDSEIIEQIKAEYYSKPLN